MVLSQKGIYKPNIFSICTKDLREQKEMFVKSVTVKNSIFIWLKIKIY